MRCRTNNSDIGFARVLSVTHTVHDRYYSIQTSELFARTTLSCSAFGPIVFLLKISTAVEVGGKRAGTGTSCFMCVDGLNTITGSRHSTGQT